jgi:hypothetical protein
MICPGTNNADFDPIPRIPLFRPVSYRRWRNIPSTDPGEAIKYIHIVARVQVVDGTLAVDLKRV